MLSPWRKTDKQSRPFPARLITLCVAAAVVVSLVAVAAARWPYLVRQYRLAELRGDPSLLEEYLLSEDGNRNAAALLFLRDDAGKKALFELYLLEFERTAAKGQFFSLLRHRAGTDLGCGVLILGPESYGMMSERRGTRGRGATSMGLRPENPARRRRVLDLIGACAGETYRFAELPAFEFQVQPVVEGKPRPPTWPPVEAGSGPVPPNPVIRRRDWTGVDYLCFFRVLR